MAIRAAAVWQANDGDYYYLRKWKLARHAAAAAVGESEQGGDGRRENDNGRNPGQRLGGRRENRERLRRACTLALPRRRGIIVVATPPSRPAHQQNNRLDRKNKTAFVNDVRERRRRRRRLRRVPPTAFRYCCLLGIWNYHTSYAGFAISELGPTQK